MNDVIDVFNNHMITSNAIAKYLSYSMGNKATPMIRHRTIKFGSICTKSHKTSLFNQLIDTLTTYNSLRANTGVMRQ